MFPFRLLIALCLAAAPAWALDELRRIPGSDGETDAVVTGEQMGVAHSGQIFASTGGLEEQARGLMRNLFAELEKYGASPQELIRVNLYGATPEALAAARAAMRVSARDAEPVLTAIQTALPKPDVQLAADAVFSRFRGSARHVPGAFGLGDRYFISGQAEKGEGTLADATRKTLEGLQRTMLELKAHPAHLKCFFSPMSEAATVREQLEKFFAPRVCPPYSLVEWAAPLIEIEVEATADDAQKPGASERGLEFITPTGMTASPVYARVVRVPAAARLIYTRGFLARDNALGSPDAELRDTFTQLREALTKSGADFTTLVKATSYVSDPAVNKRHNEIRPEYYDPKRPPAASKAMVKSLGTPNRRYTMDLIAIPK